MASYSINNEKIVESCRNAFATGRTRSLQYRKDQLINLGRLIEDNTENILETLKLDLRKSKNEALLFEINYIKIEIEKAIGTLEKFAKNENLPLNLIAPLDTAYIQNEPYGVVLVIGPWNYPFLLTLQPLIGAIQAGNAVIMKPSEHATHVAEFLLKTIPKYLDSECYQVVLGGVDETKDLLSHRFDYIFFTGSPPVGRKILEAAAPFLTPCTLELGGKSPCYIDESADYVTATKRILWAKLVNLGQTCIAPDYVLCTKKVEKEFLKTAKEILKEWYGDNPQLNPDLPRIINEGHFKRVKHLMDSTTGKVGVGGRTDIKDLWIEPTILVDIGAKDPVMNEEIFGPVLPIYSVNSIDEAIEFILSKPKPLAVYTFSLVDSENKKLLSRVSSGGACINDCLWQNAWEGLPLGGIGESGMGRYHGKFSFDTFSHKKAVLHRGFGFVSELFGKPRYPPYTDGKLQAFKFILSNFHKTIVPTDTLTNILFGIMGGLLVYFYLYLTKNM